MVIKNLSSLHLGHDQVIEPLSTPAMAFIRWLFAAVIAVQLVFLLLFTIQKSEPAYTMQQVPPMIMDYIVLAPPQQQPPPQKPQPPVKKPPETAPVPKPVPVAEAPVAPSVDNAVPADIVAMPVAPRKKVIKKAPLPVRIQALDALDNTEFEPIFNPKPLYPEIALKNNIEGYVDVDLLVNEKGYIDTFTLANVVGHNLFGTETARVIPKWRFPPPRINGEKVKVKYVYRIKFKLD